MLFAGIAVGWLIPNADLPEIVSQLGLVLFVYTLGLSSGPGFFAALRFKGFRDNVLALGVLGTCFAVTWLLARILGFAGIRAAGLFAGALTNTPALASLIETLGSDAVASAALAVPVFAYSLCYPLGVLVPLLGVSVAGRIFRVRYGQEAVPKAYAAGVAEPIVNVTVRVDAAQTLSASELRRAPGFKVNFGRLRRGATTSVVHDETLFLPGDLVTVIGTNPDVQAAARALGSISDAHIELDRSEIDFRRMFVSNAALTGRPLRDLNLIERYEAVITRARRGDVDLVPGADFELQPGDRVRVLAPRARMAEIEKLLGDSQRRVAEVDLITFSLGISLGLLLGLVPVPLPGGGSFKLGLAGGPLIVGLLLGRLGRTGPLVWRSPFAANLTLRQLGLVLFLAGVGLRAGRSLATSQVGAEVLPLLLAGAAVTTVSVALSLVVGYRLLRIPLTVVIGMLSGIQTQPAVLAYAAEKAESDLPNLGYTTVYPVATVTKILLAQALVQWGG